MTGQIVALGGGGFGGAINDRMHRYLLELTGRPHPRVLFIPTATGDHAESIVAFYRWFAPGEGERTHLPLFNRDRSDLRPLVLEQDLIYVAGGNTANLLAIWRTHGLDVLLREAWEAGAVLCGGSAGAICWFEAGVTDSFGPELAPLHDGLGWLAGSACPHYNSEPLRRPVYRALITGGFPSGYAADDHVGLHFRGTELVEIVAAQAGGRALRVERVGGEARETPLPVRVLTGTE